MAQDPEVRRSPILPVEVDHDWMTDSFEQMFLNADLFQPERFLDGKIPTFTAGFGFGRRICPGMYIAMNSFSVLFARLVPVSIITILPIIELCSGPYGPSTSNQSWMNLENLFYQRLKRWMDIYLFSLVNLLIIWFPATPVFLPWLQERLRGPKKSWSPGHDETLMSDLWETVSPTSLGASVSCACICLRHPWPGKMPIRQYL